MVPILTSNDLFELSYTYLKFMVQNCNYFVTNLIIKAETAFGTF